MKTCSHCGNSLVAGQKICDVCGEYVFEDTQLRPTHGIRAPKPVPEPRQEQQVSTVTMDIPEYRSKDELTPSQFRTRFIGICAASLAIIIIGTLIGLKFFGFI